MTTSGIPPLCRDAQHYDAKVRELVEIGAVPDTRALNWSIRLSSRYPTVEVRICDMQLEPESSVVLAGIIRALAQAAIADPIPPVDASWDAMLWRAARYALRAGAPDPHTARTTAAAPVLLTLRERVAPYIADDMEQHAIDVFPDHVVNHGTGATAQREALQREALQRGALGLSELYRERFVSRAMSRPRWSAR